MEIDQLEFKMGSGCGKVDRAVASDTGGLVTSDVY